MPSATFLCHYHFQQFHILAYGGNRLPQYGCSFIHFRFTLGYEQQRSPHISTLIVTIYFDSYQFLLCCLLRLYGSSTHTRALLFKEGHLHLPAILQRNTYKSAARHILTLFNAPHNPLPFIRSILLSLT